MNFYKGLTDFKVLDNVEMPDSLVDFLTRKKLKKALESKKELTILLFYSYIAIGMIFMPMACFIPELSFISNVGFLILYFMGICVGYTLVKKTQAKFIQQRMILDSFKKSEVTENVSYFLGRVQEYIEQYTLEKRKDAKIKSIESNIYNSTVLKRFNCVFTITYISDVKVHEHFVLDVSKFLHHAPKISWKDVLLS
jgi:uncharacterized membrane protein